MANDRDRLQKVLTLAMHPQTVQQEAHAAFLRARKIVKANPSLAHSPASEAVSVAKPPREATFEATITSVHPDWVLRQDALALAGLFTKDGVLIAQSPEGLVNSGAQAIVQPPMRRPV
jgi:hypothetical protein